MPATLCVSPHFFYPIFVGYSSCKGGVPLHWFSVGGGSWLRLLRFFWFFFAFRHDFVHIFRKFSKIFAWLTCTLPPPLGTKKNQWSIPPLLRTGTHPPLRAFSLSGDVFPWINCNCCQYRKLKKAFNYGTHCKLKDKYFDFIHGGSNLEPCLLANQTCAFTIWAISTPTK